MKTYKEIFEKCYGEDSFNEDFLISAISANGVHQSWILKLKKEIQLIKDPDINNIISLIEDGQW